MALSRDPGVTQVDAAPGNPGTWVTAKPRETGTLAAITSLNPTAATQVIALARKLDSNLVVIGPEAPLVAGVADQVRAAGIACFGPSQAAAQIEGSKQFAKQVMAAAGVPTAESVYCRDVDQVGAALDHFGPPYVVKADGLAAGKGVIVTDDRQAALVHAVTCGGPMVVEQFLDGPEVSFFAICDGESAIPLLPAQDFKRIGDGDTGPNTGGMGAYCPLPWAPPDLTDTVMTQVIRPTCAELAQRGIPFVGLLYAGLALTRHGLRVVEFNARFGDPEVCAMLPLLRTPLGGLLWQAANGSLDDATPLEWDDGFCVAVVESAKGYPSSPLTGGLITLPTDGVIVQAGTALDKWGRLIASGGRVLSAVGLGPTLAVARENAYATISRVDFADGYYRRDIAAAAAAG